MATNFMRSFDYNGSVITLRWRLTTDTIVNEQGLTESTHMLDAEVDDLDQLTPDLTGVAGDEITDATLEGLYVSYIVIDGGDPIYTHDEDGVQNFSKPAASDTITLLNVPDLTGGETIEVFYMPLGSVPSFGPYRLKDMGNAIERATQSLKDEIDALNPDPKINTLLRAYSFAAV